MTFPNDPQQPYGSPPPYGSGAPQPGSGVPQPGSGLPQPGSGQPAYGQPAPGQPSYGQPYGQSPYGQPGQPAYGQPPYGQPPYGQVPPPKKSNGGKIALIIGGIFVVLCLVCGGIGAILYSSSNDTDSATPDYSFSPPALTSGAPDSGTDQPAAPDGALNKPARDGDAEFTVTSVDCGVAEVGKYAKYRAKGQYCLVKATVKNVGSGKVSLVTASANKATTDAGQTLDAEITATVAANDDTSKLLSDVAPGASENVTWVWDIPKGQKITALKLYESFGSTGVSVSVA